MQPIKELLNKILWDKKEKPADYEIGIIDRFTKEVTFVSFSKVERVEGEFLVVEQDQEATEIPLHRIRAVRKSGQLVWKRKR